MLIIFDFDGTISSDDTNTAITRALAPERYASLAGLLVSGVMTVREVLTAEMDGVRATIDEVVDCAVRIPMRAGFRELVLAARARGDEVVILSSGFRQVIEPMLEAAGLDGLAPLFANDIAFGPDGGRITWRELPMCELCGEACKRHDVARLRSGEEHAGTPFDRVVFVGDGLSDRCGAETADRVFARASLAAYLDERGEPYESFETFHEIWAALNGC